MRSRIPKLADNIDLTRLYISDSTSNIPSNLESSSPKMDNNSKATSIKRYLNKYVYISSKKSILNLERG